jgi:para-nitrobenzyl esterase
VSDLVTVSTTGGTMRGRRGSGVTSFLGVPYAAPPVGRLRFQAPHPLPPWQGTRDATAWASRAVQPLGPNAGAVEGDEDCLSLNIWTPDTAGRHPVVFWVHGGAFIMGGPQEFDGASLALTGLVVVTIGYRIGAFGYLYLDQLAPGVASSNLALRDLIAALGWVAANAEAFGGDPGRVILAGESSGAMTVGALMTAPAARELFSGAWLMSGAARQVRTPNAATRSAEMYLHAAGLDAGEAAKVVELPTEDLARATARLAGSTAHDEAFDAEVMLPVVGDDVLPAHPMDAVARGACKGKALVVSWTRKDMAFFSHLDPVDGGRNKERYARRLFGDAWWDRMLEVYERTGDDPYIDLLTDFHFAIPALRLAEAARAAGSDVQVWRYDETPRTPPWPALGPVHTSDLFYLFTPLQPPGAPTRFGAGTGMVDEDRPLARRIRERFLAIGAAETPDPGAAGEPPIAPQALSLSLEWATGPALDPQRLAAWGDIVW